VPLDPDYAARLARAKAKIDALRGERYPQSPVLGAHLHSNGASADHPFFSRSAQSKYAHQSQQPQMRVAAVSPPRARGVRPLRWSRAQESGYGGLGSSASAATADDDSMDDAQAEALARLADEAADEARNNIDEMTEAQMALFFRTLQPPPAAKPGPQHSRPALRVNKGYYDNDDDDDDSDDGGRPTTRRGLVRGVGMAGGGGGGGGDEYDDIADEEYDRLMGHTSGGIHSPPAAATPGYQLMFTPNGTAYVAPLHVAAADAVLHERQLNERQLQQQGRVAGAAPASASASASASGHDSDDESSASSTTDTDGDDEMDGDGGDSAAPGSASASAVPPEEDPPEVMTTEQINLFKRTLMVRMEYCSQHCIPYLCVAFTAPSVWPGAGACAVLRQAVRRAAGRAGGTTQTQGRQTAD
jgi:hypothetical protein